MTKTIAVVGATGAQGGGVVAALLKKGFKVRALTRSTASDKAKALAAKSADIELVHGDLTDRASLVKAFEGTDGLFLVTDFHSALSYEKELAQGVAAIEAAKEAKVPFVVFSTLEDTVEVSKELKLPEVEPGHAVSHFDSKATVAEKLKESGLPYALLLTCAFYENSLSHWPFQKQEDGSLVFGDNLGTGKIGWHEVADIGESAAVIFEAPAKFQGQTIPVVGELLSVDSAAETLSKLSGKTVKYAQLPDEVMASFPGPGDLMKDLANMFHYIRESDLYNKLRPLDKRIYEGITFEEWANKPEVKEALIKAIEAA